MPKLNNRKYLSCAVDWNNVKKHFVTDAYNAWIEATGNIWGRASADAIPLMVSPSIHLQFNDVFYIM